MISSFLIDPITVPPRATGLSDFSYGVPDELMSTSALVRSRLCPNPTPVEKRYTLDSTPYTLNPAPTAIHPTPARVDGSIPTYSNTPLTHLFQHPSNRFYSQNCRGKMVQDQATEGHTFITCLRLIPCLYHQVCTRNTPHRSRRPPMNTNICTTEAKKVPEKSEPLPWRDAKEGAG